MHLLTESYIKKIKALCGTEGERWLESLPTTIAHFEKQWNFKALEPFLLSYNYVCPVEKNDGSSAVLKISFPNNSDFTTEITALKKFPNDVCISILKEDTTTSAVLLERAVPGMTVGKISPDEIQIHNVASMIQKLHQPINKEDVNMFPAISEKIGAFDRYQKKYPNITGPVSKKLFDLGRGIFREFLQENNAQVLLHGDLHNDNILLSNRGWLVIDPKGIVGEPEFELGAFLRNPFYDITDAYDRKKIQTRRILQFSEELGFDKNRIRLWALACAVLSHLWSIEDGEEASDIYVKNIELIASIRLY